MIGGTEIIYDLSVDDEDAEFVVRFFAAAWQDAIVAVPALKEEGPVAAFVSRGATGAAEWFFYRDAESRQLWKKRGLTPDAADAVVFVTFEEDAISFVVDAEDSASGELVCELCEALKWNRRRMSEPESKEAA